MAGWDPEPVEGSKIVSLTGLEIQPLSLQPVASRYTDRAIPAYLIQVVKKKES
jgi:hypothetical protein